jgi:plastocyanin
MPHWKFTAPLAAIVSGALLYAAMPAAPAAGTTAVRIDNFNFTPPTLVVAPGTTVTWTNADDSPHTVREKDGKFKSAALDTDDTFSHTFAAPGEYPYICTIHPYMVGKILVKPAKPAS